MFNFFHGQKKKESLAQLEFSGGCNETGRVYDCVPESRNEGRARRKYGYETLSKVLFRHRRRRRIVVNSRRTNCRKPPAKYITLPRRRRSCSGLHDGTAGIPRGSIDLVSTSRYPVLRQLWPPSPLSIEIPLYTTSGNSSRETDPLTS